MFGQVAPFGDRVQPGGDDEPLVGGRFRRGGLEEVVTDIVRGYSSAKPKRLLR